MKLHPVFILGFGVVVGLFVNASRLPATSDSSVMYEGEELVYDVSWSFFSLGQVRMNVVSVDSLDGMPQYRCISYINSDKGLPFVDVHTISSTVMDSQLFSLASELAVKKDNEWVKKTFSFQPSTHLLVTKETLQKTPDGPPLAPATYDSLRLDVTRFQDGISLFYYARANIHENKNVRVPTVVKGEPGSTLFYFSNMKSTQRIDAIDKPVRTVVLEGRAEFEGVFGFTGDFKGWFSDDDAGIPVKATLKVLLGSVDVELVEWHRRDWTPPTEE